MEKENNLTIQVKNKAIDTLEQLQKAVQESQISSFLSNNVSFRMIKLPNE